MVSDTLNAALGYTERGWHIVPLHGVDVSSGHPVCTCRKGAKCSSAGKHPRIGAWQKEASNDPAQAMRWWRQWPDSNVGLATCQEGSRLVALDIDGPEGRASLEELEATYEPLPATLISISGREEGGHHIIFRVPDGKALEPLRGRAGTVLGPGIDVRGMGGQIVAPPSMHPAGRRYRWGEAGLRAPAPLPLWLYVLLTQEAAVDRPPPAPRQPFTGEVGAWAQAALDGELAKLSGVTSQRHTAVFSAACALGEIVAAGHLPEHLVRQELLHVAYQIGLKQDRELDHQINHGLEVGAQSPRGPRDDQPSPRRQVRRPEPPPIGANPTTPPPPTPPGGADGDGGSEEDDDSIVIEVTWRQDEQDLFRRWTFGGEVIVSGRFLRRGQIATAHAHVADQVWPVALAEDVTDGSYGARVRYLDRAGRTRHEVVPASAWVDRASATKEAGRLASLGVQIRPREGGAFVEAVGEWAARTERPRLEHVISSTGWHRADAGWAWVGGVGQIYGAPWVWGGGETMRGQTAGTTTSWLENVGPLITTHGLRVALGVALAGALLQRLQGMPFLVHFAGASSSGKSRAGRLAASVWGPPETILTWQTTPAALAARLEEWSGASVVLDEVQLMEGWRVGKFIHTFSSGIERDRLRRDSSSRKRRTWSLCALSTGEVTLRTHLGDAAQGGHAVRGIDLAIQRGDLTTSAPHADELARACRDHHGALGLRWAELLTGLDDVRWKAIAERVDQVASSLDPGTDAEMTRIVAQLAIAVVALETASRWGLVPANLNDLPNAPEDPDAPPPPTLAEVAGRWAVGRIARTRGIASSPEARAWAALQRLHTQQPHRFPTESEYQRARDVIGISEPRSSLPDGNDAATVLTRHKLLLISEITGQVTPRDLLAWATSRGLAELAAEPEVKSGKTRVAGQLATWYRLHLDRDPQYHPMP